MRVLIVEDDPLLGDGIAAALKLRGWAVDWVRTAALAGAAQACAPFDAVVLDLGLPDGDGVQLLRRWRDQRQHLPVLILTARDAVESRIAGLDAGADDYLIKPLSTDELAARLRAVMRRAKGRPEPVWHHGALSFDPRSREVTWRGQRVELTTLETSLLELLLMHPKQVLSKAQIQDNLYDWSRAGDSNTVEVFIHHLRRKIDPNIVRTIRGLGYCLGSAAEPGEASRPAAAPTAGRTG
jgi:two-component system response regulator QseB